MLVVEALQPSEMHVNVRACDRKRNKISQSLFLYTTRGDGNYATIAFEKYREHKNDRDCIGINVGDLNEDVEREKDKAENLSVPCGTASIRI